MKFGPVPVDQAEGAILAHGLAARASGAGTDHRIRKGTVLTPADIAALRGAGHEQVTVAVLDPGDVEENTAAARLAAALVPEGAHLRLSRAATGRVNIYAQAPGVLRLDAAGIHGFNRVDPMITLATLPPFARVAAGGMVATVKIISYAVPQDAVARAERVAQGVLRIAPPVHATATLIETLLPDQPAAKGRQALALRLDRLGVALTEPVQTPHQTAPLATAIRQAPGAAIFLLTASATSDLHDTAPEALRQAGGTVTRFGMPVDPGNLLFLGEIGGKPVIGLPGCARSPALNGADWVLERVLCGLPVTADDIAGMGLGGLLKEIPTRPQPRARSDEGPDTGA